MESLSDQLCPRCGKTALNVYFSSNADEKLGASCQSCGLAAYFDGSELVAMKEYS